MGNVRQIAAQNAKMKALAQLRTMRVQTLSERSPEIRKHIAKAKDLLEKDKLGRAGRELDRIRSMAEKPYDKMEFAKMAARMKLTTGTFPLCYGANHSAYTSLLRAQIGSLMIELKDALKTLLPSLDIIDAVAKEYLGPTKRFSIDYAPYDGLMKRLRKRDNYMSNVRPFKILFEGIRSLPEKFGFDART